MKKETIYLSTISTDAPCVAREHSFGLELAEFCTAWNMDEKFIHVDSGRYPIQSHIPHYPLLSRQIREWALAHL